MDQQIFLGFDDAVFDEIFGEDGSNLSTFLNACLSGYEGKTDYRDFTPAERDEILMNAVRMLRLLEEPSG